MPSLSQVIEADAAARLPRADCEEKVLKLDPYREFLKMEFHRLQLRHRAGAGGREICRHQALVIDLVLRNLWDRARGSLSPQAQKEFPPLALVALGGYGRGELNPHSDLDVMWLHYGQVVAFRKPLPHLSKMIDWILMPLFDLNFKVGHSVRTIQECVDLANQDMQTKTSLIEARRIIGDASLCDRLQKTIVAKCVEPHGEGYIRARLEDQAQRRAKHGNSPTMQEPNVKNGCGGLRDYQNLFWMAFFKYRTRSMEDLQTRSFITAREAKTLDAAYDFLLSVRNEMHYQTGRATDILTRNLQPAVAYRLGYTDRSPRRRLEKFMRQYYNHSRNLYLIIRTVEERLALLPKPSRFTPITRLLRRPFTKTEDPPVDGFKFIDGQIYPSSNRVFRDQPRRLMRIFLHAQQRGLRLHPDTAQMIRHQLHLVDRKFLRDEGARETFLEILNQRGSVGRILRTMHEVGLLGKYLPEFGRLTCLVQHEFYHQYTADEHTLVCLEMLDQIWAGESRFAQRYAEEFQAIERPFILYLAMLLHDAGKADPGGNHSAASGLLSVKVARRLDLDDTTARALRLLIENHLVMANISQRRDLDDPTVIRHFAKTIESVENLRMLAVHTFADSLATSDKLWNGFKDSLLWELYQKTADELTGATVFLRAEAKQRELLEAEVARKSPRTISDEERQVHFHALPARYFQIQKPLDIVRDLVLTHRFMSQQLSEEPDVALKPVLAWLRAPDRGHTRVQICTWDRAGLFSTLAGSFAAAGINILSAQVFTRHDNIVLDTFLVTAASRGGPVTKSEREKFEAILIQTLTRGQVDFPGLIQKQTRSARATSPLAEEGIPLRIEFDNDASNDRTVIEIETEDQLGLLFKVSRVLALLGLDIDLAKILTEKGAAIDSFYVAERDGSKVMSPERQRQITARLREAIETNSWPDA